jgi:septal ring factor EnvC (AmiA/AmiB activator)
LSVSEKHLSDAKQQAAEAADLRWQMAEKEKSEEALKLELAEKNALLAERDARIKELEKKIASLSLKREAEYNIIRLGQLAEE